MLMDIMNTRNISETLRRLLFNKKMKIIDLARATHIPQPTVQRMVAGNCVRPHLTSLQPIARFFNITIPQLLGQEPIDWMDNSDKHLEALGIRRVPLLEWSEALSWIMQEEDNKIYPKILTDTAVSSQAFALTLKDAAMDPVFSSGTQVIFDPNKVYRDRYYVLVKLEQYEEPIFRQLILDGEDMFIKPLSPDLEHFRIHMLGERDIIYGVLVEAKQRYAV